MNDYNKLRKSIKSILSEQELTANVEDERKPIMSFVEDDPEEHQVQDDISQEELYDLLYNRGFKVGFVEYKSLMHLLCVLKVYGQNNSLPQVLQDFIQKVEDLEDNVFKQAKLSASHNISNKNRLVEIVSDESLENILSRIMRRIFKTRVTVSNPTRKTADLKDVIKSINNEISKGLGWFVEVLFFTYCKENCRDKEGLFDWFNLELSKLETQEGFYNASIDYAVSYFLIYKHHDENSSESTANYIENEIIGEARWNHRNEDVNALAKEYIGKAGCSKALKDAQDLLRAIAFKTSEKTISIDGRTTGINKKFYPGKRGEYRATNSSPDNRWVPGQIAFNGSPHPEYDLWLIRKEDEELYDSGVNTDEDYVRTLAMIDLKSYALDSETIYPTSIAHKSFKDYYEECNYFGFINFERSCSPFKEDRSMSEFKIDCKFFILHKDKVEDHLSREGDAKCETGAILFNRRNGFKQNTLDDLKEDGEINIEKINHIDFYKTPIEEDVPANNSIPNQRGNSETLYINRYFTIKKLGMRAAQKHREKLLDSLIDYIESKVGNLERLTQLVEMSTICEYLKEYFHENEDERLVLSYKDECPNKIGTITNSLIEELYRLFYFSFKKVYIYDPDGATPRKNTYKRGKKFKNLGGLNGFLFKETILKDYFDQVEIAIAWSEKKKREEGAVENASHNIKGIVLSENLLRSVIRNILREGDKKKRYSGSHPEESYGWSAKEEDFMFDKPGITTWEEDRQWVKEYLKSMGMLKNKK